MHRRVFVTSVLASAQTGGRSRLDPLRRKAVGELSDKAKPMRGTLRDLVEIVATDTGGTYRLMYTFKLGEVIYVLHAFQKGPSAAARRQKASSHSSNDVCALRGSSMKTEMIEGKIVRTGSGNVFADLGLPNPEERLLKLLVEPWPR